MTVQEIMVVVDRDRPFFDGSGGGVTFSGGEPFAQPRFLQACLESARSRSIHTAVDTCGFVGKRVLLSAAALTDLFLYDLKIMDPDRHLALTGVPLAPILENLRTLDRIGATVWLRMPLVPGYNDDRRNLEAVGAFATSLRVTRRLHLLAYHRLGVDKRRGLGIEDEMPDVMPPSPASVDAAVALLRGFDLDVRIGG